jgi:hypothetical protein
MSSDSNSSLSTTASKGFNTSGEPAPKLPYFAAFAAATGRNATEIPERVATCLKKLFRVVIAGATWQLLLLSLLVACNAVHVHASKNGNFVGISETGVQTQ